MTAWWITGDARTVMADLPPRSVDLVLTSPPFLALRTYLPDGDPAKELEMGSEANPAEFIDGLLDVTEACARLLTPHGTLAFELGDTYAGSGGAGGDYAEDGLRAGQPKFRAGTPRWDGRPEGQHRTTTSDPVAYPKRGRNDWPLDKSLSLIPETYRFALAYGRNPHTGRTTDPWRIRNVVRWVRPNPPVGALGDKFRPATSEMVVACKARDRWFDLDAVRSPLAAKTLTVADGTPPSAKNGDSPSGHHRQTRINNPVGAPPLDWWEISPGGFAGAHYAVYPPELCVRPVEAMCPRRVCRTCGAPSRRLVDASYVMRASGENVDHWAGSAFADHEHDDRRGKTKRVTGTGQSVVRRSTTTGWSTCGCRGADGIRLDGYHSGPGWRPGVVLDPFGGSGTTASVASGHSRDSISIDLDARNVHLARERVGMWLTEVTAAELTEQAG